MSGRRNYWHVYNHMRRQYMDSGRVPVLDELLAEFDDLELADVQEGIAEYEMAFGDKRGGGTDGLE
ncbi:hypothetical protein KIH86_23060 [Paenibacillus sp. HN-1]|uniref:hypothetical protein n=1 Tax=Paenibacillus TaxID=44249 RepID=UPI001CA8781A|nr:MULTISPECIES: hypothetical protein [Paenibacillus]MBY9081036.1 hypothetical protein [Paenibacillus sp. CGMCC 1.18879]MBY9087073.1 hypothetical protein [Paenibacillus sinensis]